MSSPSESSPPRMPPLPNPLPPDEDRGPQLMGAFWTWSALSIILVALRFYARYQLRAIGLDDWMMLFTVTLFIIATCFVTYMAHIGGARHAFYLTPEETLRAVKFSFLSQPWAIFLFATGKTSVALLTLRIIGGQKSANSLSSGGKFALSINTKSRYFWRRTALYFLIVSLFIVCSLGCIFTFVQCNPPRALWTPELLAPIGSGTCWDPKVQLHFNYFLASWNIMADVVLALLPATFISGLKLRLGKKIALCILLSLGLIAAVFSAIKVPYLADLGARVDFTWNAYGIQMWTGAEAFVMILCGNIPPLQILWDRFITHKVDSSYNRVHSTNNNSGGSGGYNNSAATGRRLISSRANANGQNSAFGSHNASQYGGEEDKASWSGNESSGGKNEIVIMTITGSGTQGQAKGPNKVAAVGIAQPMTAQVPKTGAADRYYYTGSAKGVHRGNSQIKVTTDVYATIRPREDMGRGF
ncbi:hypothetical protein V8F33_003758 [Rhypophila sp. PSN 637]